MADYKSKVHSIYGSIFHQATPKLGLHATVMFNKAEGGYEQINMPDPYDAGILVDGELENADFDYSGMHTYSALDYKLLQLKGGFVYNFTPDLAFTADGLYADLTDNEGYVYGDDSGSMFIVRSGVKITF